MSSFGPASWLRVVGAVGAIVLIIRLIVPRWLPGVEFDWLRALAISIAIGLLPMLLAATAALMPRRITLGMKQFKIDHASGLDVIPFRTIHEARLERPEEGAVTLVIRTARGAYRLGIAPTISIDLLMTMLSARLQAEWTDAEGVLLLRPARTEGTKELWG
jgi:hypothetical protein